MANRIYHGTEPKEAKLIWSDGEWNLYETAPVSSWRNFKLVSVSPRPFKANYYLGFDTNSLKIVNGRDSKGLKKFFPDLYERVKEEIMRAGADNA